MAGMNINLFSKYTTLFSPATVATVYPSEAFDVTQYGVIEVTVTPVAGTVGATFTAQGEESGDLETWNPIGSATTLTPGTPAKIGLAQTERYIRVRVTVQAAGNDASLTLWARAVARETT